VKYQIYVFHSDLHLKRFFGRYHHLTLPHRVSVTTIANDISRQWYWNDIRDIMTGAVCGAGNA